ncbi:N-lysine methyltransferase setd6 isoform X1 [Paramormyrops kingsleyae]|uniref:N-lysine methyltransferase setd6 isoform X1 n=1 Tax=Paramormyrops kingsleyae TaxID=1676925 RepID=UPI003B9724E7
MKRNCTLRHQRGTQVLFPYRQNGADILRRDSSQTIDNSADLPLRNFLSWCETVGITLSDKVCLSKEGTVAEYGMLAKDDIEEGETLFVIPRRAVLSQSTTKVKTVLEEGKDSLESSSGWVPLLLALMLEYTTPESYWRSYLALWPDFKMLDHPMFWSKGERDSLLQGTGVPEAVDTDLANIQNEYNDIVLPFIRSHPDLWNPEKHNFELYKSLVAFVMAYSFQEPVEDDEDDEADPNPPMMVPMGDMLNHTSNHNTNLEYSPEALKMVSVCCIRAGEEVFNTYGQMANWQLLHMYGFIEPYPSNTNDTADIQMTSVYKAALQGSQSESEKRLLVEKWELLCEMEMVGDKGVFIFSQTGSLTDTELYATLKVLCLSAEEFEELRASEAWEEVEDEPEKMALAFSEEGISKLKPAWKQLVHGAARITLDSFAGDLEADKAVMDDEGAYGQLSCRQKCALQVRYGQKVILHQLLRMTQT